MNQLNIYFIIILFKKKCVNCYNETNWLLFATYDEDLDNGQMNSYGIQIFISDHCKKSLWN